MAINGVCGYNRRRQQVEGELPNYCKMVTSKFLSRNHKARATFGMIFPKAWEARDN